MLVSPHSTRQGRIGTRHQSGTGKRGVCGLHFRTKKVDLCSLLTSRDHSRLKLNRAEFGGGLKRHGSGVIGSAREQSRIPPKCCNMSNMRCDSVELDSARLSTSNVFNASEAELETPSNTQDEPTATSFPTCPRHGASQRLLAPLSTKPGRPLHTDHQHDGNDF